MTDGPPAGYEEVQAPQASAVPEGYEEVAAPPPAPTGVPGGTIGPQRSWKDLLSQSADAPVISQSIDKLSQMANFTQQGVAEHPVQAAAGQLAARLKQMFFGGTGGGLDMKTGFANNPVTSLVAGTPGLAGAASKAAAAIPSTETAGAAMNELRTQIGSHPVEITDDLSRAAMRVQELKEAAHNPGMAARQFINRITDPSKGQLTYAEARDFLTRFGETTTEDMMKSSQTAKAAVQRMATKLKEAVTDTAARAGQLEKFQSSINEYRSAKKMQEVKDFITDFSVKGTLQKLTAGSAIKELADIIRR